VVEVDGKSHDNELRQMKDALKDQHLTELGYKVMRFKDSEIYKNLKTVITQIKNLVGER